MSEVVNIEEQFSDALAAQGLYPPEVIADGKLHRFDGPTDKRGKKSAWYVLHSEEPAAGAFGCWKTDLSETWCAQSARALSPAELDARRKRIKHAKARAAAERATALAAVAESSREMWENARAASADNPYCIRKGVKPYGLKEFHDRRTLIVPIHNAAGALVNLQFIDADGTKRFRTGGEVAGCSYAFGGNPEPNGAVLIGEGFATCASAFAATGLPVVVAFNAGNLLPVAQAVRERLPAARVVMLADDDHRTEGNPGVTKATEAARAVGGSVAVPIFGEARPDDSTDFNDLQQHDGLEAVRACIEAAMRSGGEHEGAAVPSDTKTAAAPRKRSGPSVVLTRACDIVPEPIYWLWPGYLPAGKFTAFAGPAGCGKTTIAVALAATVSCGGTWPDGAQCPEPGNVVIWTGEDGLADTLVPRLMAAGADLARVRFIESVIDDEDKVAPFDPSRDVPILSEKLAEIGGARLLIVDPIISAVRGDGHKAIDVRISLQPLLDLGAAHGCAILGITHFSKGSKGTAPNDRLIGSQAFGAAARVILVAGRDESSGRRIFAKSKANITDDAGGFEYAIEVLDVGEMTSSRIQWGQPLTGSAAEILREIEADETEGEAEEAHSKFERARAMLYEWLRPFMSTREMKAAAMAEGVSWRTVEAAKQAEVTAGAKIRAVKQGKDWGWIWDNHAANHPDEVRESSPQLRLVSSPQSIQVRKDDCGVGSLTHQGLEAKSATPQSSEGVGGVGDSTPQPGFIPATPKKHCGVADLPGNPMPERESSPQSSPQYQNACGLDDSGDGGEP